MGAVNVILTCLTCDIDTSLQQNNQVPISHFVQHTAGTTVTAGNLVSEFTNLMFLLNPFGSPCAKWRAGGNFISSAAGADGFFSRKVQQLQ